MNYGEELAYWYLRCLVSLPVLSPVLYYIGAVYILQLVPSIVRAMADVSFDCAHGQAVWCCCDQHHYLAN